MDKNTSNAYPHDIHRLVKAITDGSHPCCLRKDVSFPQAEQTPRPQEVTWERDKRAREL